MSDASLAARSTLKAGGGIKVGGGMLTAGCCMALMNVCSLFEVQR